jgi:hypothetical protein
LQCIAVRGLKGSGSEISKILIQALWVVALFELVKGDFLQEIIISYFGIKQRKNNGFLLT